MSIKRKLIVALVCINVVLTAALMFVASTPTAQAQPIGATTDYLIVPGRVASDRAAIYVVDLARQALGVWQIDTTTKKFEFVGARDLKADFPERPKP